MARVETSTSRPYHLVIFGASGFTGQFVVEEVARTVSEGPKGDLKWAVAGRSKQKLEKVLEQAAGVLSKPELRSEVDIIVADVEEPDSLAAMCKQAVIVLNCVGPYRFYGEQMVKACVENGAHHIDISGEPQFLEGMQLNYNSQAAEKGVYIIGSCGFDSIPADMGVLYTREQFKGTLTAVESFLTVGAGDEGGCIHDGTWQSAIYGFSDGHKLQSLRRKFNHKPLPTVGSKLKRRGNLFYSNEIQQYTVPFMGSDPSVVKRTQRFLVEEYQDKPVQYGAYAGIGGIGNIVKLMFAGMMFWFLVKFSFGRNLLIKHPEFFSFGLFSKAGPTRKQMEASSFQFAFYGEGYTEGQDPSHGKPNAKIRTLVQGPECGYVATPITMVQAALTILNEPTALPKTSLNEDSGEAVELIWPVATPVGSPARLGTLYLAVGEWQQDSSSGSTSRVLSYTIALNNPLGPKTAPVVETQTLHKNSAKGECFVVDSEVITSGIPYQDYFYTVHRYCLTSINKHKSRLRVSSAICYRKQPWSLVKALIEKNTWSGIEEYYRHMESEVCKLETLLQTEVTVVTAGEAAAADAAKTPPALRRRKRTCSRRQGEKEREREGGGMGSGDRGDRGVGEDRDRRETSAQYIKLGERSRGGGANSISTILLIVSFILVVLVALNMLLFYKLYALERAAHTLETWHSYSVADSPLPQTAGEWAQVLQLQRQFHQAQLSKWQQILQSSVTLLDQMKQSLEKLHRGIVVPEVQQDPPDADDETLTESLTDA